MLYRDNLLNNLLILMIGQEGLKSKAFLERILEGNYGGLNKG
jgi:hypothetical protein